ncbi:efflux RND transporter permease subunit [Jannaschia sp. Os4]|uniref:efflux RND transporter permease subunit n=1 Tax=Jannaschia sp. Os4 TaxID=2807617 RepID=UPI0019392C51|nr:efflux RND transporter permease subunit [Jannaschia sp. Os4]MBM2576379.1 efflux RND transporter permease subunit [Jannaschia sp. Os4]
MLTRPASRYPRLVFFLVAILMAFGAYSYLTLPAQEDPAITIREAIVTTRYPGLSPERMEQLVTKPLEVAINTMPEVEEIRSSSTNGLSIIHVEVADRFFELDQIWDDLRVLVERAAPDLPDGATPPVVTDDVGDVAVMTVALRGPDYTLAELEELSDHVRDMLVAVPGAKRVEVSGLRPERIYVETRNTQLAELGISTEAIIGALRAQNVIRPGGEIDTGDKAFLIEPTGDFRTLDDLRDALIRTPDGGTIALRDVAEVRRDYADPIPQAAFYQGEPAIVLAVSMQEGQNVLAFIPLLEERLEALRADLPVGTALDAITDQSVPVERAVYGVTISVLQTLGIVLAVVVLLLGFRTGFIVGAIVPIVMLATLAVMGFLGLPLERMSLATLVIALGLLVDGGVVVAEDFKTRLAQGDDRDAALDGVGKELSLPLLSSTATTVLVFLPLMLAEHVAGEYTRSISIVIAIALSLSWLVAMTVTPILCHRFATAPDPDAKRPWNERMFDPLIASYRRLLGWVLSHRLISGLVVVACFIGGAAGVATAPSRFFPGSDRAQIITYLDLPAGVTADATEAQVRDLLPSLTADRFDWLEDQVAYVGYGGPRFVLSLTPIDPAPNRAVLIANVDAPENVGRAVEELRDHLTRALPDVQARVTTMFLGPSDSSILEVQVKGPDRDLLYAMAGRIEMALAEIPGAIDIRQDWENRIQRLVVEVDQNRARRAGVTSADVARSMSSFYSGRAVTEYREGDDVIPVIARASEAERTDLDRIRTLAVFGADGTAVPLAQVADVRLANGYARIERENLMRTVTVQARSTEAAAEDMAPQIEGALDELRAELPPNHSIEFDGIITQSAEGRASLLVNMPLCFGIMVVLLVAQFNSFRRPLVILATVPLIVTGVALGLRLFGANFGFMPILGMLSLAGIILNNAIVLIDRIDIERADGKSGHDAIIDAAARRLRPIVMTTLTTVLGLLPLILSNDPLFYGMAAVMAAGLFVGTALTLGVVPLLYAALFARDVRADSTPEPEGAPA